MILLLLLIILVLSIVLFVLVRTGNNYNNQVFDICGGTIIDCNEGFHCKLNFSYPGNINYVGSGVIIDDLDIKYNFILTAAHLLAPYSIELIGILYKMIEKDFKAGKICDNIIITKYNGGTATIYYCDSSGNHEYKELVSYPSGATVDYFKPRKYYKSNILYTMYKAQYIINFHELTNSTDFDYGLCFVNKSNYTGKIEYSNDNSFILLNRNNNLKVTSYGFRNIDSSNCKPYKLTQDTTKSSDIPFDISGGLNTMKCIFANATASSHTDHGDSGGAVLHNGKLVAITSKDGDKYDVSLIICDDTIYSDIKTNMISFFKKYGEPL